MVNFKRSHKFFLALSLIILYSMAWLLQSHFLLKGDVAWQMKLAKIVLAGGNYVTDFFEINPPLSIYLYMPAVLLEKITHLPEIPSLRIYIFFLTFLSLLLCYHFIAKIFSSTHRLSANLFFLTLAIVFTMAPMFEFGQREHLLIIFTVPYLLLLTCRAQKHSVALGLALLVGFLAGIGFAIKPFFLLTLVLIEGYYLFQQPLKIKSVVSLLRPETIILAGTLILYASFIYIYFPSYVDTVVPIATRFYYKFFGLPLWQLVFNPIIFYIAGVGVIFWLNYKNNPYRHLSWILLLATLGYLSAYFMQQLDWYYHLIPAISISLLLYVLLFSLIIQQMTRQWIDYWIGGTLAFLTFFMPIFCAISLYNVGATQKENLQPFIQFLIPYQNQPIYFFSTEAAYMVSVLEHAGAVHASRLQFLAPMKHYLRPDVSQTKSPQQSSDETFFINILAEDINQRKPTLILIDTTTYITRANSLMQLDFLKVLQQNYQFKEAFKPYHFLLKLKEKSGSQFDVYQRVG